MEREGEAWCGEGVVGTVGWDVGGDGGEEDECGRDRSTREERVRLVVGGWVHGRCGGW